MSKISVGTLAKKLGVEPKEAIAKLKEIGVDAKTATSQVDEDLVVKLTAPQPRENGTDEVRVASNIIRRRAKAVPVQETVESAAPEAAVEPVVTAPVQAVTPEPVSVPTPPPAATAADVSVQGPASAPDVKPVVEVSVKAETPVLAEPSETVAVAAAKPVVAPEPQKAGPNQARILGMIEIPGVTNRPTRVVTKDSPVQQRTAPPRPASDAPKRPAPAADQRRPAGAGAYEQRRPASPTPSVPATELDRSRMKQVQLAPAAPPGGDNRRGVKKDGPGYGDAGKGAKKGAPAKKKEQPRKNEILEKRERTFDPVYKGSKKRGAKERVPDTKKTEITVPKAIKRIIKISESITVGELAKRLGIKANDLIKSLMKMGMMVTINHPLDYDTAVILASEYDYEVENVAVDLDEILESTPDAPETFDAIDMIPLSLKLKERSAMNAFRQLVHGKPQLEKLKDGSWICNMDVENSIELTLRIIQCGDAVEILGPEHYRRRFMKRLEDVLAIYR